MKIVAISDIHGYLPEIPKCDLLVIAGDLSSYENESPKYQRRWLQDIMRPWLHSVPAKSKIYIPGNHDWFCYIQYLERQLGGTREVNPLDLAATDATHLSLHVNEEKIYGLPFIPNLKRYAFYMSNEDLRCEVAKIPKDITILVSHSPPFGCGDTVDPATGHVGNLPLADALRNGEFPELKLIICGHVHESYGSYWFNTKVRVVNCCVMDRQPLPVNPPQVIYV